MALPTIFQRDTIVACATPPGLGAVSIIRLSGPQAKVILMSIWHDVHGSVDKLINRRMYYGNIVDNYSGNIVDNVLMVSFSAPNSYTGEEVVEVHTHGNPVIVDRVIRLCTAAGARLAEPGEFTRRAFLNGRMDLAQAEAVAQMIAASSDEGLRRAQAQQAGQLSTVVRTQLRQLTELRAFVEATIDFPEEDIEHLQSGQIAQRVAQLQSDLRTLLATAPLGRLYQEGARVVLLGPPNAGKSSLFNAWLGEARALVHPVAGTTRDVIEETVLWDGLPIRLIDTAGVRELTGASAPEMVETLGIERTKQMLSTADCIVTVLDGTVSAAVMEQQLRELQTVLPPSVEPVVFFNKSDVAVPSPLPSPLGRGRCGASGEGEDIVLYGSATTGDGLGTLRARVTTALRGTQSPEAPSVMLTTQRHVVAVEQSLVALDAASQALTEQLAPEFIAEDLLRASNYLGQIVGDVTTDDLLGEIFSRFCIGK